METLLQIKDLKHSYNSNSEVLKGIDMEVAKGEIISILGPSGCGKTTLLRIIAGLEICHSPALHNADACLPTCQYRPF